VGVRSRPLDKNSKLQKTSCLAEHVERCVRNAAFATNSGGGETAISFVILVFLERPKASSFMFNGHVEIRRINWKL